MTYFIIGKNEDKANLMFDSNQLGEESLGTFYPAQGFAALHNMINMKPESLDIDDLDKKVINDIFLNFNDNTKFLVFGLGYDSKMWYHGNKNTYFVENNKKYVVKGNAALRSES